jgi:hypothetical protein
LTRIRAAASARLGVSPDGAIGHDRHDIRMSLENLTGRDVGKPCGTGGDCLEMAVGYRSRAPYDLVAPGLIGPVTKDHDDVASILARWLSPEWRRLGNEEEQDGGDLRHVLHGKPPRS